MTCPAHVDPYTFILAKDAHRAPLPASGSPARGLGLGLTCATQRPIPGATVLATDSQSARDVSYNPEHHDRMKHVERRHFFIRDTPVEY